MWPLCFSDRVRAGLLWFTVACALAAHAQAQTQAPQPTREALAAERAGISKRFDADEAACHQRFAVTGCVADVRASRRDALAPVRERELQLEDRERRERGIQRELDLAAKHRAQRALPAAKPPVEPRTRTTTEEPPAPAPTAAAAQDAPIRHGSGPAAQAAERAKAAAKRREDALATQAEIAKKLADRAARGKPVVSLPVPVPVPVPAASTSTSTNASTSTSTRVSASAPNMGASAASR
jgi:colicin import membrane protein